MISIVDFSIATVYLATSGVREGATVMSLFTWVRRCCSLWRKHSQKTNLNDFLFDSHRCSFSNHQIQEWAVRIKAEYSLIRARRSPVDRLIHRMISSFGESDGKKKSWFYYPELTWEERSRAWMGAPPPVPLQSWRLPPYCILFLLISQEFLTLQLQYHLLASLHLLEPWIHHLVPYPRPRWHCKR